MPRPQSYWLLVCFAVGIASALVAAVWLLTVDSAFLSDGLTLGTSLAVGFLLPIGFAATWPKRVFVQRMSGSLCGVAGACTGMFVLANIVAVMHSAH